MITQTNVVKSSVDMLGLDAPQKRRLQEYCERLGSDTDNVIFDDSFLSVLLKYCWNPRYVQYVRGYLNRIDFCQSRKSYAMIRQQVEEGFCAGNFPDHSWLKKFQEVLKEAKKEFESFGLQQLQFRNDEDVANALPKLTTHAGWYGYIQRGHIRKGDNLEGIYADLSKMLAKAKIEGTLHQPMMPGVRTQSRDIYASDDESLKPEGEFSQVKTRTILMVSMIQIVLELMWAKPLQAKMHDVEWYMGGFSDSDIHKMIRHNFAKYKHWLSIDYSKYDVTISDWLLRAGYDVFKQAFIHDPQFDEQAWNVMVHDAICKDIVLADGKLYRSTKGNSSGLMFTSMNASIVNYLCIQTCLRMMGVYDYKCMIMGDDNIIFSNEEIDFVELSDMLARNFGLIVHPHKCVTDRKKSNPVFLSREWRFSGEWRAPIELLANGLFPERWRDYREGRGATPELVVYSYILAYPLGMRELMDVDKFMSEFPNLRKKYVELKDARILPGSLRYRRDYELALDSYDVPYLIAA